MWDPKTIRGLVLFLCGIQCLVSSASNCSLKMIQNGIERTDLSCTEYDIPAADCRWPNNPNLPIVDDDLGAIGAAGKFESEVDRSVRNFTGVTWNLPRLHLSWYLPTDPSSVGQLKGFLIDGECVESKSCPTSNFCTMFQVTGFNSSHWNVEFQYEKVLNISSTFYHLKLYTLPRTLSDGRLVKHHYRDINGASNNGPTKESAKWTTSPKLQFNENNVTLKFKYPDFDFTHYQITLKDSGYKKIDEIENMHLQGSTHAEVTFYNVPTGKYFIDIEPKDQFPNDDDKCQCYTFWNGDQKQCEWCGSVETSWFNITATALPPTTTPSTTSKPTQPVVPIETSSSQSMDQTSSESSDTSTAPITEPPNIGGIIKPEDDNSLTIGLAVGLTIVFALAMAVMLYYMIKCRKTGDDDPASLQEKAFDQLREVPIEEKTVFVLSADDHVHHLDAVKQLVMFLKDKCHCKVIYPPWEIKQIGSDTWRGWLHKRLDQTDYVLVVNSEASYNLLKASTSNKSYRYKVLTDSAHLFNEVLTEILKKYKQLENVHRGVQTTTPDVGDDSANRLDIDKFLTVSFYYTPKEYYLTDFRINFELVQQLPNLIRYIHKLQANSPIPLDLKDVFVDVPENDCKAYLESAVQKAGRFQKSDVLWFSERFGDAYRRETERHDSGYDEQDDISRSRSTSQKSQQSTDEFGFIPPSILSDGESRVGAPEISETETMSFANFSFIPPDAVSRGVSEFCSQMETQDGADISNISRQFRDMNKKYEDNMCTKV